MFLYKWVVTKINVFVTNPLIETLICFRANVGV